MQAIDIVRTIYKELFYIKLVHKAYASANGSSIFSEVNVVPDASTKALFKRYEIEYRLINDTIVCFMRSELVTPPNRELKKPFVTLEPEFMIRFLLTASSGFFNRTYIAAAGSSVVYHFTNRINNVQASDRYITKTIENYNAGSSYDAGTVVNSAGEPFASLQPVNAADGIAITNAAYWKKVLPSEQSVNNADIETTAVVKPGEACFAVIDVFNTGTTNATYNLFGSSQQLLSPQFIIPFKSKI
jgi:hypothetical protein